MITLRQLSAAALAGRVRRAERLAGTFARRLRWHPLIADGITNAELTRRLYISCAARRRRDPVRA